MLYWDSVQSQRPTFRPDLIAKPVTVAGKRLFEVRDPGTGRILRFSEDGYSIAYLLNGKRSHLEVVEEFFKQRGARMSLGRLGQLIEQLELLGCLVCDPNLTVPYHALATVAIPVLGDGGMDEALATVVLGAEAFKDYYTIVPDVPDVIANPGDATRPGNALRAASKARAKLASCGSAVRARTRANPKRPSAPPPIPLVARSRKCPEPAPVSAAAPAVDEVDPTLPPLPAWPALDNAMRSAGASAHPPVQARALAPTHFSVPKPQRFPRARAHAEIRRAGYASAQSLWLAGGFFAASLLWASWALFRLGV